MRATASKIAAAEHAFWPFSAKIENRGGKRIWGLLWPRKEAKKRLKNGHEFARAPVQIDGALCYPCEKTRGASKAPLGLLL